jgi:hypothetical protein
VPNIEAPPVVPAFLLASGDAPLLRAQIHLERKPAPAIALGVFREFIFIEGFSHAC